MSDVFISYAHSTATQAQAAAAALRALGYSVWLDEDLPGQRAFTHAIQDELANAKAALVVWSADGTRSEWVLSEANRARDARKLVQVAVDKARLPMPFDQIQCADIAGWSGDPDHPGWKRATDSIAGLVRGRSPRAGSSTVDRAKSVEPLLAVLAFDNLSGDPDVAYFSDGVSEEILQTVARGANLKVIGRASSFQFRGAEKAAGKVAAALKATHILDGSVRRSGSRVRISAQIIECDGQTTIWSDSYEGELVNVFALQDEIAASVAAALKQVFTPPRGGRNIDPESYDLFLRSRALSSPSEVITALEEVTARAPGFARAWASLGGWLCAQARYWEPDPHRKEEMFRRAENAARRALALDPDLGTAHTVLADAEPMGAWSQKDAHLMRALDLSPDRPEVLQARGQYLACVGRFAEAWEVAERGYALDPLWEPMGWRRGILLWLTDSPDALPFSRERASRNPDQPTVFANLWALNSVFAGDWASFADIEKAPPSEQGDLHRVRRTLSWGCAVRDGDEAAANRMVRESEERLAAAGGLPFEDYLFLLKLGRVEAAFDLAARSTYERLQDRTRDTLSSYLPDVLFFTGAYRGFTDDPRIVQLFAKLGLCDYWLASDRWPDCADAVPYDFRAEARKAAGS